MKFYDYDEGLNNEFNLIIEDIINNNNFKKLKKYVHHNSTRFQHSLNVCYCSYKVSKFLKLDYYKISRAALLHDYFFIDNHSITKMKRLKTLYKHPKDALENSKKEYELSRMEENIILSHMFPVGLYLPKCKESLLVNFIDNYVSIREVIYDKKTTLLGLIK